jgi:hypothetical protein
MEPDAIDARNAERELHPLMREPAELTLDRAKRAVQILEPLGLVLAGSAGASDRL